MPHEKQRGINKLISSHSLPVLLNRWIVFHLVTLEMDYVDDVFIAERSAQPDCQQPDTSSQLFTDIKTTARLQ